MLLVASVNTRGVGGAVVIAGSGSNGDLHDFYARTFSVVLIQLLFGLFSTYSRWVKVLWLSVLVALLL